MMTGLRYIPSVILGCSDSDVLQIVELCFSKDFKFDSGKSIAKSLPPPKQFFKSNWRAACLEQVKNELNAVKSKLNHFNLTEWHEHTSTTNHAGYVIRHIKKEIEPELATQAWCKFQAIIGEYQLIPSSCLESGAFNSLHLCEAPGAFIASLNHYIKQKIPSLKWDWRATTLNPYYEGNPLSSMINDDRLIFGTMEHWCFGEDNTGDIFSLDNLNSLMYHTGRFGDIHLVTADGSIDCQDDPGEQELIVCKLHYAETITALHILAKGGSFVLKMFTCFEAPSICLLYFLYCTFEVVHMVKPAASKEGNSEVYLVCLGYHGKETISEELKALKETLNTDTSFNMFSNDSIPYEFLSEVILCARRFKDIQVSIIERNIELFHRDPCKVKAEWEAIEKIKRRVAAYFIEKYDIRPISKEDFLVPRFAQTKSPLLNLDVRFDFGSFIDRRNRSKESRECVQMVMAHLNLIKFKCASPRKFLIPQKNVSTLESVLSLKTGRKVSKVLSSKFCSGHLLDIFNMLIDPECYTNYFSKCFRHDVQEGTLNVSSLPWLTNFYNAKMNAYHMIKGHLEKMVLGDEMTLLGFPLLSNFNVGLVYCLAFFFNEVFLNKNYELHFIGLRSKAFPVFDKIHNSLKQTAASEYFLLSLVPMTTLIESRLYKSVVEVNHSTLEAILLDYCEALRIKNGWSPSRKFRSS